MQLKQAVDAAYELFIAHDVPSPRLNAELLLLFVLGRERVYLFAHPERELSAEERTVGGCRRRLSHARNIPVAFCINADETAGGGKGLAR